ncbi:MAG: EndoU domain-containing protein [Planctomycetes bacterium]|nr:EndoU domain-containing protein [Planctomycetota bacterium]
MSFERFMTTALARGASFDSGKAVVHEFEACLPLRYPGWTGPRTSRQATRYAEELAKAPREYEVITGCAAAAEHCARNLAGIERRYVEPLRLVSLFNDGDLVYRYKASTDTRCPPIQGVYRYRVANPTIKKEAWDHVFFGNDSGDGGNQTHTGLHWRGKFNAGNHSSRKGRQQITIVVTRTEPTLGIFKANVRVWAKAKASTFFPDAWGEAAIRDIVTSAARFRIAKGPGAGQAVRENRGLVNWAGKTLVRDAAGALKPLRIGGLGDPGSASGVTTAFPEYQGSFDP